MNYLLGDFFERAFGNISNHRQRYIDNENIDVDIEPDRAILTLSPRGTVIV